MLLRLVWSCAGVKTTYPLSTVTAVAKAGAGPGPAAALVWSGHLVPASSVAWIHQHWELSCCSGRCGQLSPRSHAELLSCPYVIISGGVHSHTLSCTYQDLALVTTREESCRLCRTVSVMSGVEAKQGGACLPPPKYKQENHTFWYHVSLLVIGYCGLLPVGHLLALFIIL